MIRFTLYMSTICKHFDWYTPAYVKPFSLLESYLSSIVLLNEIMLRSPDVMQQIIRSLEREEQRSTEPFWKKTGKSLLDWKSSNQKDYLLCLKLTMKTEKKLEDSLSVAGSTLYEFLNSIEMFLDEHIRINGHLIDTQESFIISYPNLTHFKENLCLYQNNIAHGSRTSDLFRRLVNQYKGIQYSRG